MESYSALTSRTFVPHFAPDVKVEIAQAPVGYDQNSYAYRDVMGTKFHESIGQPYGQPYGVGDVVGCWIQVEALPL